MKFDIFSSNVKARTLLSRDLISKTWEDIFNYHSPTKEKKKIKTLHPQKILPSITTLRAIKPNHVLLTLRIPSRSMTCDIYPNLLVDKQFDVLYSLYFFGVT